MSRITLLLVLAFAAAVATQPARALAQAAAAPAAGAKPAEPAEPEVFTDPAVLAVLSTNPETPPDLTNAILLLLDLKQIKPAKMLFTKLVGQELEDAALVDLGKKVGTGPLYRLTEVPEFRPQAKTLADKVVGAMNRAVRDPDRLATLIERLKEPSLDVRVATIGELRQAREAAAQALVTVLYDPARAEEYARVRAALAGIGADGIEPLALISGHAPEADRIAAIKVLGITDDSAARGSLYAAAFESSSPPAVRQAGAQAIASQQPKLPTPVSAAAELYLDAKRLYLAPPRYDDLEPTAYWKWDSATKRPVMVVVPDRTAALVRAGRLAEIAAEIAGHDPHAVTLAQAASLEAALRTPAAPKPAAAPAEAAPAADGAAPAEPAAAPKAAAIDPVGQWNVDQKPTAVELRRLLEFTAANDRSAEVTAVIRLLAMAEGVHALDGIGGRPSPLVKLTTHPDRRIRFAAMEAIVRLNPQQPFTGSSAVADALGYFAASTGERKTLVADPNIGRARDVAGVFAGHSGARGETASNARDAVRIVAGDPDIETLVMYRPMMLAELGQLLAQYRADYRTARLPAFIYCEPDDVGRTRTLLANDPLAYAIYQPRTLEMLQKQSGPDVTSAAAKAMVPAAERVAQANVALAAIGRLLATNNKVFNLRPFESALVKAAWSPTTSDGAVAALANFGSPAAQRTLADLASASTWSPAVRQTAARAFNANVGRFGTLLTTAEVAQQYERYNAAENADQATQEILASLLDTIEARATKLPPRTTSGTAVKPIPVAPPPAAKPQAAPPAENEPKPDAPKADAPQDDAVPKPAAPAADAPQGAAPPTP